MPQKISLKFKPKAKFEIPASNGYQIYSALLAKIESNNEEISKHVHDSSIGSISISGLNGRFRNGERPNYRIITPENLYETRIGIIDPKESDIFKSLISQLIFSISEESISIELDGGDLEVVECQSQDESFEEILRKGTEKARQTAKETSRRPPVSSIKTASLLKCSLTGQQFLILYFRSGILSVQVN